MVTKSQIQKLREPSLKLVDHVTIEMLAMVRDVAAKVRRPSNPTTRDHLQHTCTFSFSSQKPSVSSVRPPLVTFSFRYQAGTVYPGPGF